MRSAAAAAAAVSPSLLLFTLLLLSNSPTALPSRHQMTMPQSLVGYWLDALELAVANINRVQRVITLFINTPITPPPISKALCRTFLRPAWYLPAFVPKPQRLWLSRIR
jgi:hypothetical protein